MARTISITQDGIHAGDGTLRDGVIEDCPACLGPSRGPGGADAVEAAYRAIEDAIARGEAGVTHDGVRYEWMVAAARAA